VKYCVYACEKSVCISLEQNVRFALHCLGVDPCSVSGQVVIIGLLTVQIHNKLCSISWNWLIIGNGNL